MNKGMKSFVVLVLFVFALVPPARAGGTYADRPDIMDEKAVPARALTEEDLRKLGLHYPRTLEELGRIRRAELNLVAEVLEMNPPPKKLLFAGRDAEYLYDLARAATKDTSDFGRLELVPLSGGIRGDGALLKEFLTDRLNLKAQRELKESSRSQFVLIDVGLAGSTSEQLERLFAGENVQIQTQLITSSNRKFPSIRTFLYEVDPATRGFVPAQAWGVIRNGYEELVKFTPSAKGLKKNDQGGWDVSTPRATSDYFVNPPAARSLMSDIREYARRDDTQKLFGERRAVWKKLYSTLIEGLREELKGLLAKLVASGEAQDEAIVRDFLEVVQLNLPKYQNVAPSLKELGLRKEIDSTVDPDLVAELKRHPELEEMLAGPRGALEEAFKRSDLDAVARLLSIVWKDHSFVREGVGKLLEYMKKEKAAAQKVRSIVRDLLKKRDDEVYFIFASVFFSGVDLNEWRAEIQHVVENCEGHGCLHALKSLLSSEKAGSFKDAKVLLDALALKKGERRAFLTKHGCGGGGLDEKVDQGAGCARSGTGGAEVAPGAVPAGVEDVLDAAGR